MRSTMPLVLVLSLSTGCATMVTTAAIGRRPSSPALAYFDAVEAEPVEVTAASVTLDGAGVPVPHLELRVRGGGTRVATRGRDGLMLLPDGAPLPPPAFAAVAAIESECKAGTLVRSVGPDGRLEPVPHRLEADEAASVFVLEVADAGRRVVLRAPGGRDDAPTLVLHGPWRPAPPVESSLGYGLRDLALVFLGLPAAMALDLATAPVQAVFFWLLWRSGKLL